VDRRAFIGTLAGGLLAAPLAAEAQRAEKLPRIGILWAYSPSIASLFADAFRQGLRGLGYIEGENIALEERWAEGRFDHHGGVDASG
jgi:putative ABC transport system substrate-binding protein